MAEAREYPLIEVTWQDARFNARADYSVDEIRDLAAIPLTINVGYCMLDTQDWICVAAQKDGRDFQQIQWIPRSLLRPPGIVYFEPVLNSNDVPNDKFTLHVGEAISKLRAERMSTMPYICAICRSPSADLCDNCNKSYCPNHWWPHYPCVEAVQEGKAPTPARVQTSLYPCTICKAPTVVQCTGCYKAYCLDHVQAHRCADPVLKDG